MRAIAIILGLCSSMGWLMAQDHWARRVGAWSNDAYNALVVDAEGHSYVVGEFGGAFQSGGTLFQSEGSLDIVVAKYGPTGDPIWVSTFGGPGLDRGVALALGPAGELVMTGQFMGQVQFGAQQLLSLGGTLDVFLLRVDPANGDVLWARRGGGAEAADQPFDVSIGPDGRIAVTGEFRGTALFDAGTLTSVTDPDTDLPSADIFVAAYDADGDALWLKHGAAEFSDRGASVLHDALGNVYVAGQFSDTLTFDQVHNNAMFGAVFIVRFSSDGVEQWFRVLGGGLYNQVHDMVLLDGDRLLLTGDAQGTLIYLDDQPDIFQTAAPRSSFLVEVDLAGTFIRQTTWGSEHVVHTRSLSVHDDEVGVFGRFQCQFTGFSALYGAGTWLATGSNDLYVAAFDLADLSFLRAQQFGGKMNKAPGTLAHLPDGAPVFCGSFEYLLVFPSGPPGSFNAQPAAFVAAPASPSGFCDDPYYGNYTGLVGAGLMDAFIARGWVEERQPYDIFARPAGPCERPLRDVRITVGPDGVSGPDTLQRCQVAILRVRTNTSYNQDVPFDPIFNAPALNVQWSTGNDSLEIYVYETGWYHVTVTSLAGCWSSTDSIYMIIDPLPEMPLIHDDVGLNLGTPSPADLVVCEPMLPWLWATGIDPTHTAQWSGPSGVAAGDSIQALADGNYAITITSPEGCVTTSDMDVTILATGFLPPLEAVFEITFPQDTDQNDTIEVCMNQPVFYTTAVTLLLNGEQVPIPYGIRFYRRCGLSTWWWVQPPGTTEVLCTDVVSMPGWYTYEIGIMLTNAPCGGDTLLFERTDSIYVAPVMATPPTAFITGPTYICPGDTVTLEVACTNCDLITWSGDPVLQNFTDSVWVTSAGDHFVVASNLDNGCVAAAYAFYYLDWNPSPVLGVLPADGVMCPGSTATVFSSVAGTEYQWYGPMGPIPTDSSIILTDQPGLYYLDMVDVYGCPHSSAPIQVTEYSSPYLHAVPDNLLCEPGETALLQVVSSAQSEVLWLPPLSGGAMQQVVDEPGTYSCAVQSCGNFYLFSVEVFGNEAVAALVDEGPFNVCPDNELLLQAEPGMLIYYWQPGGVFAEQLSVSVPGAYTLSVIDWNGCEADTTIIVGASDPVPLVLGSDTLICPGGTALFELPPDFNDPLWSDGGTDTLFTTGNAGQVSVSAWDVNGCLSTGTATVSVYAFVQPAVADPVSICTGADGNLEVVGSGSFTWFADSTLQVLLATGTELIVPQPADSAVFYVVQTEASCAWPTAVPLYVTPVDIDATLIPPGVVCEGSPFTITLLGEAGMEATWSTPVGAVNGTAFNAAAATQANTGTYTVTPFMGPCQGASLSTQITVLTPTPLDLGPDSAFCDGAEAYLQLPDGFFDPTWSTGSTADAITITTPGSYSVAATDAQGCMVQDLIVLDVVGCPVFVPNVFSPNGDGLNDVLELPSGPYISTSMSIFDRWGSLVWEGDPTRSGFRGVHHLSNEPLSEGVYYYVLRLQRSAGRESEQSGYMHLLR